MSTDSAEIKARLLNLIANDNFDANTPSFKIELENILSILPKATTSNNTNNLIVRILSTNEYKKYIKNDTLNGSITAYNINVWHSLESSNKNYDCVHGHNSTEPVTFNYTYYTELIADNLANQYLNSIYNHNYSLYYYLSYSYSANYDVGGRYYRTVSTNQSNFPSGFIYMNDVLNIPKSNAHPLVKTQTITRKSGSIQDHTYNATFNFYYISLFRPVFQYIDNQKSANIYS